MNTILCLGAQTMDPRDEDKFDFDPLDVTKIWPEHLFPLQPVGRMVLNKVRPGAPCFMCMVKVYDSFTRMAWQSGTALMSQLECI